MNDKMMKMLAKGKKRDMSDTEKEAKLSVLRDLRQSASQEMAKKLSGMKKPEGEEQSEAFKEDPFRRRRSDEEQERAEEPVQSPESAAEAEEDDSYAPDEECTDPDEIDAKIAKLMAMKDKIKSKNSDA